IRHTLSRSTTTKSRSEYAVKTLTQKSTLGSIEAGRGNGSLVSDDALGGAAKPNAIASANAAIALTVRFAGNFASNNTFFLARESPFAHALPDGRRLLTGCPLGTDSMN